VDLLANKVDVLPQHFDRLGTPSSGSQAGSSLGAMFGAYHYVRYVAFKATLLLSVIPLTRELSMHTLYKTSTLDHKITQLKHIQPRLEKSPKFLLP